MNSENFDTVLDAYFQEKQAWTLTEALYLAAQIDPSQEPPIDDNVDDADGLARLYKLSRKSIKEAEAGNCYTDNEQLPSIDLDQGAAGADRFIVDPRDFVRWIGEKSPAFHHMLAAEDRYQAWKRRRTRRSFKSLPKTDRDVQIRRAVIKIAQSGAVDFQERGMISSAARTIQASLENDYVDVVGLRTIRNQITDLIDEGEVNNFSFPKK